MLPVCQFLQNQGLSDEQVVEVHNGLKLYLLCLAASQHSIVACLNIMITWV